MRHSQWQKEQEQRRRQQTQKNSIQCIVDENKQTKTFSPIDWLVACTAHRPRLQPSHHITIYHSPLSQMDETIAKLQAATDEASTQLRVCKQALEVAATELAKAKDKYRALNAQLQESGDADDLMVNDTELPELLETQLRAKNLYDTVEKRYNTNKRYLEAMIQKRDSSKNTTAG